MAYYLSGYTPPPDVVSAEQVRALQKQLNAQGANLSVDGVYGPRTDEAYRAYSLANGLKSSSLVPEQLMSTYQDLYEKLNANAPAYTPTSEAEYLEKITAALGPGYDQAMAMRREQTTTNKAEIDADAAARGMGSSTWVTDMKDRQAQYEADDIATLEGQKASAIAAQLLNALQNEKQLQYSYDALAAGREADARAAALNLAQGLYGEYLAGQRKGRGGPLKKAEDLSPNELYTGILRDAKAGGGYFGAPNAKNAKKYAYHVLMEDEDYINYLKDRGGYSANQIAAVKDWIRRTVNMEK